jgi:UDP-apiose/xylose synthase
VVQTINLAAICTPADYNTRPLDTIYSNFIDALPVVMLLRFVKFHVSFSVEFVIVVFKIG